MSIRQAALVDACANTAAQMNAIAVIAKKIFTYNVLTAN